MSTTPLPSTTIEMVDLKTQYQNIKSEIDTAVQTVIDEASFINGAIVKEFAANLATYLHAKHVIPCANGTDAIQIAFMALELQPGDEIICPAFTYAATIEVAKLLHLRPIYVDIDPHTFNIDTNAIEAVITPKTKAIIPVHLFGQSANMEIVMQIANKYNLYVIEDTAQAIGADYTFSDGTTAKAGTIGHIGTTSFFPSKNLGCYGDGGAIFTNDHVLAEKLRVITDHGQTKKYHFEKIGVNSRLDSMQAAILNVKLKYLHQYTEARQKAAAIYDAAFCNLTNLQIPYRDTASSHVFHQYTLRTNGIERDTIIEKLKNKNIPCMVYYPKPMHVQPAYLDSDFPEGAFPHSEQASEKVFSLPMHTELTPQMQQYIIDSLLEICNS